jgi:hypothetical protein
MSKVAWKAPGASADFSFLVVCLTGREDRRRNVAEMQRILPRVQVVEAVDGHRLTKIDFQVLQTDGEKTASGGLAGPICPTRIGRFTERAIHLRKYFRCIRLVCVSWDGGIAGCGRDHFSHRATVTKDFGKLARSVGPGEWWNPR